MSFTESVDGAKRMNLRISGRVGLDDIAICLASRFLYEQSLEDVFGNIKKMSTTKILEIVRDEIWQSGLESIQYRVGDNAVEGLFDGILEIVAPKFNYGQ